MEPIGPIGNGVRPDGGTSKEMKGRKEEWVEESSKALLLETAVRVKVPG